MNMEMIQLLPATRRIRYPLDMFAFFFSYFLLLCSSGGRAGSEKERGFSAGRPRP